MAPSPTGLHAHRLGRALKFPVFKGIQDYKKVFKAQTVQGRTNDQNLSCRLNALFPTHSFDERCHQLQKQQPNCLSCFHGPLDTMLQERTWLSKSKEQVLTAKNKFSIKNLTELTLLSTHAEQRPFCQMGWSPPENSTKDSLGVQHLLPATPI